ncbi:hypothetical protein M0804_003875 [Polistes exclamans]|nr:hypothetical protein M0804_003875 [Polistes exclamans]
MCNLSTSIIVMVFMSTGIIHGLLGISISTFSERFEEDLSFHFEKPMDRCNNSGHDIVRFVKTGLEVLRDNFIVSDYVKTINLEDNKIVYISPNAFEGVPYLSCLNIRHNYIETIFENFLPSFNHTELTTLNLAHTAYKKLSNNNKNLNSLDFLDSNKTISVGPKSFLPNVKYLDISNNKLYELPAYLNSSYPRLTHLYASDNALSNSTFKRIPATTQYLYLERNRGIIEISYFPKNIYGLFLNENNFESNFGYPYQYSNLRILSLRKCNRFNEIFPYLNSRSLVELDISSNNIDYIDSKLLRNTTTLKRLSLDRNSLDSLLFLYPLDALIDLSIAYNKLVNITSNFFQNLIHLEKLNLRGNRIALIDNNAFSNLKVLEKLDLAENRLMRLPESWMKNLINLRYLNLKSNMFANIDKMYINIYSRLNNLFVENNNFTQIEMASLVNMPSTVIVHLSSINSYTCIT